MRERVFDHSATLSGPPFEINDLPFSRHIRFSLVIRKVECISVEYFPCGQFFFSLLPCACLCTVYCVANFGFKLGGALNEPPHPHLPCHPLNARFLSFLLVLSLLMHPFDAYAPLGPIVPSLGASSSEVSARTASRSVGALCSSDRAECMQSSGKPKGW